MKIKKYNSKRRFGVEIEICSGMTRRRIKNLLQKHSSRLVFTSGYRKTYSNNYWHVKTDSTCGEQGKEGPPGLEVVTYICSGIKDLDHIIDIAEKLQKAGARVNMFCGLHIHADATNLTKKQVGKIAAYWIKTENILSYALPKQRLVNNYCKFLHDRLYFIGYPLVKKMGPTQLYYILKNDFFHKEKNETYARRHNLNLINYMKSDDNDNFTDRKTLELRWPEGTLDKNDIKNWVILFLNFVDICSKKTMPKDLNTVEFDQILNFFGIDEDDDIILDQILYDLKKWFLHRICKNNEFFFVSADRLNRIIKDVKILLEEMKNSYEEYLHYKTKISL